MSSIWNPEKKCVNDSSIIILKYYIDIYVSISIVATAVNEVEWKGKL